MTKDLVTIVTVVYNLIANSRKETFIQAMESVHNQTYKDIEHLVIDGASNDGTIELLKEYENKGWIKFFSEKDSGIYDAMNKAIQKANGKYINFLNSDDYFCDNNAVQWSIEAIEKENADYSFAQAKIIDENSKSKKQRLWISRNLIPFRDNPCHQTVFVKTEAMREIGGFDLSYKISADSTSIYMLYAKNKKSVYLEKPIIAYRYGGFSGTGDYGEVIKENNIRGFYKAYGQYNDLSLEECTLLWNYSYVDSLDTESAVDLGCKLKDIEWRKAFFRKLFEENKIQYKLFGFLPLWKIKKKQKKEVHYLFNLIPVLVVKKK